MISVKIFFFPKNLWKEVSLFVGNDLLEIVNNNISTYVHVADVEVLDMFNSPLNVAFIATNSYEKPWINLLETSTYKINILSDALLRSSSTGDIFEINDEKFLITSSGFTKI